MNFTKGNETELKNLLLNLWPNDQEHQTHQNESIDFNPFDDVSQIPEEAGESSFLNETEYIKLEESKVRSEPRNIPSELIQKCENDIRSQVMPSPMKKKALHEESNLQCKCLFIVCWSHSA